MRIGIIGAGIGGLSLGVALTQRGLSVRVHEKAPYPQSQGAGIVLAFNGFEVMKRLGLDASVLASGKRLNLLSIVDQKFQTISRLDVTRLEEHLQSFIVAMERSRLHRLLLASLGDKHVSWGDECTGIEQTRTHVVAKFCNGAQETYDLVVAADGLHSTLRRQLFPTSTPRYSGQTSWRSIASCRIDDVWRGCNWEAWGAGKRFGMVELPEDKVYWYAVRKTAPGGKDDPRRLREDLRSTFEDFHPIVDSILQQTPDDSILRTDISDIKPLASWHEGRILLLGDAAHATTPNLGQGGNQALEDAWCLAGLLAKNLPLDDTLRRFESARLKKANQIVRDSRLFGWLAHIGRPQAAALRNALLRLIPAEAQLRRMERLAKLREG